MKNRKERCNSLLPINCDSLFVVRINEKTNARQVALTCLYKWEDGRSFAETLVDKESQVARLSESDRKLVLALVFSVIRNISLLNSLITELRDGKIDTQTRLILQLGLAQLFLLNLSSHAAVFETVNLAPQKTKGLINAILRSALRRQKELEAKIDQLTPATRYSTPKWLVNRWENNFGHDQTLAMLQWNNMTPTLFARKTQGADIDTEALRLTPIPNLEDWYEIQGRLPLEEVRAGKLYISDPSTRYAIDLLAPVQGESILDACAAPGGKAAAIISKTQGVVKLVATDLHDYRLPTLLENLQKQGGNDVSTAQADWSQPCPEQWKNAFDAVLLDVPCSNTGVIQRRVDVRWRLTAKEITRLADLQFQILENASQAVKQGGRLVYSTCSIDQEEDRAVIDRFLATHPEWSFVEEKLALPHIEKSDGAYAALLKRQ